MNEMADRGNQVGTELEKGVEALLKRLGLKYKHEPLLPGDKGPRLDFFVEWTEGCVWIEAKARFDEKVENLQAGESCSRTGDDILNAIQGKVDVAYKQYERQRYNQEAKLIVALSYTFGFQESVMNAVLGNCYDVGIFDLEEPGSPLIAREWERKPSQVFTDKYPNLVGILHLYTLPREEPRFTYYPNINTDWRKHTPPQIQATLTESQIQHLEPVSLEGKWDPQRYGYLRLENTLEVFWAASSESSNE